MVDCMHILAYFGSTQHFFLDMNVVSTHSTNNGMCIAPTPPSQIKRLFQDMFFKSDIRALCGLQRGVLSRMCQKQTKNTAALV